MLGPFIINLVIDFAEELDRLRGDSKAVILAHYYQDGAIQDIGDFEGDSLDLARKVAETDAEVTAFATPASWGN